MLQKTRAIIALLNKEVTQIDTRNAFQLSILGAKVYTWVNSTNLKN